MGSVAIGGCILLYKRRNGEKTIKNEENETELDTMIADENIPRDLLLSVVEEEEDTKQRILSPGTITIAHASVTGTCKALAEQLQNALAALVGDDGATTIQLCSTDDFDWWDELLNNEETASSEQENSVPPIVVLDSSDALEWNVADIRSVSSIGTARLEA